MFIYVYIYLYVFLYKKIFYRVFKYNMSRLKLFNLINQTMYTYLRHVIFKFEK